MFYQVRIYTPKGRLRKVITTRELSQRHWRAFETRYSGAVPQDEEPMRNAPMRPGRV